MKNLRFEVVEIMFFIGTVSHAVPKAFLSFIRQILLVAALA